MDFDFTEDQEILRAAVRGFVDKYAPVEDVHTWDETGTYPKEFFRTLANDGYFSLPLSKDYGGSGCGAVEMLIVGEELGRRGLDIAAGYGLTVFMAMNIERHGTEEQKSEFLPKVMSGDLRFSISMTEPNAGSDAAAIKTTAAPDGTGFRLNGQKVFTTGAGLPNTVLHVTARTEPSARKRDGISVFLVSADAPGIETRRLRTVGRHILGTYEVFFDEVYADRSQLLGELHRGWDILQSSLELERLFSCAGMVGAAQTVFDMCIDHVNERRQFGQPIGRFQAVAHKVADMHCAIEASRLLSYRAAFALDRGRSAFRDVAVAKLFTSEALQNATNVGMQLMGGYGYMLEYDMQRFWRDARVTTVTAGTSEIQRTIIARLLGCGVRSSANARGTPGSIVPEEYDK